MSVRTCSFQDGLVDGAIGLYRPPHRNLKIYFSFTKKARDILIEDNKEYKSGFDIARQNHVSNLAEKESEIGQMVSLRK